MPQGEQEKYTAKLQQFVPEWDSAMMHVVKEMSDYFGVPIPDGLAPDNAASFLEKITSERMSKHADNYQFVVISASPGTGKTAVGKALRETGMPKLVRYTTRPQGANEIDGVDYHFVNTAEYRRLQSAGVFVHDKLTYGEHRGIAREDLQTLLNTGKLFYVEGDALAFSEIANTHPEFAQMRYVGIYLLPPDARSYQKQLQKSVDRVPDLHELELRLTGGLDYLRTSSRKIRDRIYEGYLVNLNPPDTAMNILKIIR